MSGVKFREILRLSEGGYSDSEISRACRVARSTVQDYVSRARVSELTYEKLRGVSDSEALKLLGKKVSREGKAGLPEVDFAWVHSELSRRGVTLLLLWEERLYGQTKTCSYSTFCRMYKRWELRQEVTLRQFYRAGEKCFVDFSGLTLAYTDIQSGEIKEAEIFVGTLGASNYTYVEATASQELFHWIGAHCRLFGFFGGVTEIIIPDNLKSAVTAACRYEPEINRTYQEFAEHYGVAVLPARTRKPRDKAKVEKAVQDIQRWILAPLRDRVFHSVSEINQAIKPLLEGFNARMMREYEASRHDLFLRLDKPALAALPVADFEWGTWKTARVNIDYHLEHERHYYSAPYYLVRREVWVKASEKCIEIFFDGKRVALHERDKTPYTHSTLFEHMPPEHQAVRSWTRERFTSWSKSIGTETEQFVEMLFAKRAHEAQAFRSILGLQRLAQKYSSGRLEQACKRANHFKLTTMRSVRSILETGKDKLSAPPEASPQEPLFHANLRGISNFH